MKLGGGGLTYPGVQGNPYPKLKIPRIWPTIFLGETQVHVQKQTKIKMNDNDSPKLGGRAAPTQLQSCGGKLPPLPPPPPRFPASLPKGGTIPSRERTGGQRIGFRRDKERRCLHIDLQNYNGTYCFILAFNQRNFCLKKQRQFTSKIPYWFINGRWRTKVDETAGEGGGGGQLAKGASLILAFINQTISSL